MTGIDWTALKDQALGPFSLAALPANLQLPALPHAVALFIEKSRNDKASLAELASIVETDTGLTVDLLRHVNSAFVGLRQKAKTVSQAIALLGIRQTKLFVIANGTQAAIRARRSRLINQSCFWNSSLQKALFAREVADLLKADADTAFAGALLQDFLLPVLTNDVFDPYMNFVNNRRGYSESICDFEQTSFGWDHALAAGCMATRWLLPDELVCCILFHHRGLRILGDPVLARTPAAAVALSALLPDQLRQQYTGLEQLVLLETKWPAFKLANLVETVDRKHRELGFGVNNDFPLSRRCKQALEKSESGLAMPELQHA
jgi:HD-like signal output (HDOD) protein